MPCRLSILTLIVAAVSIGCETKRVEYRKRPAWMSIMGGDQAAVSVREDGTEVHWIEDRSRELHGFEQTIGGEQVRIRTDHEDGTIELRTVLPMHLVVNLLECLRRSEYRVIWTQLISSEQRDWYEARGDGGYDEFLSWFQRHRKDLATLLNRMHAGKVFGEVMISTGDEYGTVGLRPNVAYDFKLNGINITREDGEWKISGVY
ncbi:MAG: hypothetical protein GY894_06445 [Planctomycetes bacterium]|nr:hypothetical protein [Planctomycetota bacterium]